MGRAVLFTGLFVIIAAVSAFAQAAIPADTVITLRRGACEMRCAVYDLSIQADGSVVYDGRYYVRRTGRVKARVARKGVRRLIDEFQKIGFFSLKDEYTASPDDCVSLLEEAPRATISIVMGKRAKTIVHNHRCVGKVSSELTRLEDAIDAVAKSVRWIK